jgi:hypothetical protein
MSAVYTVCDWEVDSKQLRCIWRMHEALGHLGGTLRIIPQVVWHERHLFIDTFALKTPSRDVVETVKPLCEGKLILENWRDATELDYEQDFAFNPFCIPAYDRRTWEARVHIATEHNFRVRGIPLPKTKAPINQWDKPLCGSMWDHLSVRVFSSLRRTGMTSIDEVLDMLQRGPDAMLAIRNFGEKSLDELIEKLREIGYSSTDNAES